MDYTSLLFTYFYLLTDGRTDRQTDRRHIGLACIPSRGTYCPILMKFGTLQQILNPMSVTWPKIIFFLNSRWRTAAMLKIAFWAPTHKPIIRLERNFVWGRRMAWRQRPRDKSYKCRKSEMESLTISKRRPSAILDFRNLQFMSRFSLRMVK